MNVGDEDDADRGSGGGVVGPAGDCEETGEAQDARTHPRNVEIGSGNWRFHAARFREDGISQGVTRAVLDPPFPPASAHFQGEVCSSRRSPSGVQYAPLPNNGVHSRIQFFYIESHKS